MAVSEFMVQFRLWGLGMTDSEAEQCRHPEKQFGGKKDTPNLPKDKKKKVYSDKGKKPTKKFDKRGKA